MNNTYLLVYIGELSVYAGITQGELIWFYNRGYFTGFIVNREIYFELSDVIAGLKKFQLDCETI